MTFEQLKVCRPAHPDWIELRVMYARSTVTDRHARWVIIDQNYCIKKTRIQYHFFISLFRFVFVGLFLLLLFSFHFLHISLFRFVFVDFVLLSLVLLCFRWFRFVSFRFVLFLFGFALYRYPAFMQTCEFSICNLR
jgi:hypothetical protein